MPRGCEGQEFGQGRVRMGRSLSWEDTEGLGLGSSGAVSALSPRAGMA